MTSPPDHSPASRSAIFRVVVVLGPLQILGWGTTYYLITVIGPLVAAEMGWPLATAAAGFSVALLASSVLSPVAGRAIDALGGRGVLALGSVTVAAGQVALATAWSLPHYFTAWVLIGFGMALALYDAAFSTLAGIFGRDGRRAIAAVTLFGGFASTAGWPATAFLSDWIGWRDTVLVFAALNLLVAAPMHRFLVPVSGSRHRPAEAAVAAPPREGDRRLFLLLVVALAGNSLVFASLSVHLLEILGRYGYAAAAGVAIGTLIGPAQVAGRIMEMVAERRIDALTAGRLAALLLPLALLLLIATSGGAAAVFAVAYGISNGVTTIARGNVPLLLFGPVGYGRRQGVIAATLLVSQAAAPIGFAAILERFGVETALYAAVGVSLVALAAFAALKRPA